jgi:hypothetical protein
MRQSPYPSISNAICILLDLTLATGCLWEWGSNNSSVASHEPQGKPADIARGDLIHQSKTDLCDAQARDASRKARRIAKCETFVPARAFFQTGARIWKFVGPFE